jgi:hypothetical protein
MFEYTVTADGVHVVITLDDHTGKPQTWIIPRHAAEQMAQNIAKAAKGETLAAVEKS